MLPRIIEDGLTELHRQCVERRGIANQQLDQMRHEYRELMQKIRAAEKLLGNGHISLTPGVPLAEAVLAIMRDDVARDAKAIRGALKGLVSERFLKMPTNTLYSTLHRLQNQGELIRNGSMYRARSASAALAEGKEG